MVHEQLAGILRPVSHRLVPLLERFNRNSLRERGLIFGAILVATGMAWQVLLMDPLAARAAAAEQKLADAQQSAQFAAIPGEGAEQDPAAAAMARDHALRAQRAALEQELIEASHGYVPMDRMADVVKHLLTNKNGLRLVGLRNLPAESLVDEGQPAAAVGSGAAPQPEHGPYLHPVEIELEGDYASVVSYLKSLENLPWQLRWRALAITAKDYPVNRVRIEIATLSLSRDWMNL